VPNSQPPLVEAITRDRYRGNRFATRYLSAALFPLVLAYSLRSLVYDKHLSWYSWAIGAATSCVYTFGFVLMCPQLYINHQLKSVSHLPWNVRLLPVRVPVSRSKPLTLLSLTRPFLCGFALQFLIYKFINTFIDGKTQTSRLSLCVPHSCLHHLYAVCRSVRLYHQDAHDAPAVGLPGRLGVFHLPVPALHLPRRQEPTGGKVTRARVLAGVVSIRPVVVSASALFYGDET
jgi:hypothetical protein